MGACSDNILPKDVDPNMPVWKLLMFIPEHILLSCFVYLIVFFVSMFGFHFIILFAVIGVIIYFKDKIVGKPKIIACVSVLVIVVVLQVVEVIFLAYPMWRSLASHPSIYTLYPLIGVALISIVFDLVYFRQVIFKSKESNKSKDNINQPLLANSNPPPLPPKPPHLLNKGPPPPLPPKPISSTPPPLPLKPPSLMSPTSPVSPPATPPRPPRPYPVTPVANSEGNDKVSVPVRPPRPDAVKNDNVIVENSATENVANDVKIEIQS